MRVMAIGLVAVFAALAGGVVRAEGEARVLRLVAHCGERTFDAFAVEDGMIVVRDGDATHQLAHGVQWDLKGDLWKAADLVGLAPPFDIVTRPAVGATAEKRTSTTVIVRVGHLAVLYPEVSAGGLAVVAWLVDGQVRLVVPKPMSAPRRTGAPPSTVLVVNLPEGMRDGSPVVLLWKDGKFVRAHPLFTDPVMHRVAMAIYLRRIDPETADAIRTLPSINNRDYKGATLLHHAARAGFVEAVEMLLARGADVRLEDRNAGRPLHDAARAGRAESVRVLVASGAKRNVHYAEMETPLDLAVRNGAVDAAIELLHAKPGRETEQVLKLAVRQGNAEAIRRLLLVGASRVMRKLKREELVRCVSLGDEALTQALLDAGMNQELAAEAPKTRGAQARVVDVDELDVIPVLARGDAPDERSRPTLVGLILPRRDYLQISMWRDGPGFFPIIEMVHEYSRPEPVFESVRTYEAHWAVVSFIVETDGRTNEVSLVLGTPIDFAGDAAHAVRGWTFTTGMLDGCSVRTRMTVVVTP